MQHEVDVIAGDSECVDSECSLNALQLTARARAERGPTAAAWGQCGGNKWKGATECAAGSLFQFNDGGENNTTVTQNGGKR